MVFTTLGSAKKAPNKRVLFNPKILREEKSQAERCSLISTVMLFTKRSSRVSDLMAVTAQRNQVRPNQTQLGTLFQRFDVVNVLRCCHFPCCLTVSTEWVVLPETLGKSSPAMVVTSCSSLVAFVAPITAVVMSLAAYTFHVAPKMDPLPPKKEPLPQLRDRGRGVSM